MTLNGRVADQHLTKAFGLGGQEHGDSSTGRQRPSGVRPKGSLFLQTLDGRSQSISQHLEALYPFSDLLRLLLQSVRHCYWWIHFLSSAVDVRDDLQQP
jgi:hypothetical protein